MSFEAPSNVIIAVVAFCKALYRNCRDAGDSYDEISREVRDLHTVLRHLKYEAEDADSLINRDHSLWSRQLAPMIGNCDLTLRELDAVLRKYNRLAGSANSSPTTPRAQWARLASNEMDSLGAIRVKLISHKGGLTQFLNTIQIDQSGQMEMELDNHSGQLDAILDKVDAIAARMGQGNKGLMANYDDDDKEVWKQFRRELIAEGFSGEVLMQHRDVLRAYIREIDQKGLLDETPTQHTPIVQGGANPERWLESVQSNVTVNTLPPTFSSLNVASDDAGAKMIVQEDNMKFPQSIKMGRPVPESREILEPKQNLETPLRDRRTSSNTSRPRRPSSSVPRLITTQPLATEEVIPFNNNQYSISPSDSESDSSKQLGLVIQTTDLLAATRALSLNPGSPLSFRSQSSFGGIYENDATRSIAQRPQKVSAVEYGSSPIGLIPGAIPIPNSSNPRSSAQSFSSSPSQLRSECSFKLAPDSQGKEIPPDAKWTKINRRLISPEVLDQDRRRYEARPDFVAVLGVLSREEIDRYARRSHDLREARRRRYNPQIQPQPSIAAQAIPQAQPQPPRTISAPRRAHFGRETPSSSSSNTCSSDSESSDSSNDRRGGQSKRKSSKGYAGSNVGIPISGYPNPFGSPPSPVRSPGYTWDPEVGSTSTSTRAKEREGRNERDERPRERGMRDRSRDKERDGDRIRDREKSRDRDRGGEKGRDGHHRHRHHHHGSSSNTGSRNKSGSSEKQQKSSRWKENLTAAGIGGAAVSLLNVLSEAAEGL